MFSYQQYFHSFLKQKGLRLFKCEITRKSLKFLGPKGIDATVRRHLLSFIDKLDLSPYRIKDFSSKFDEYLFFNYESKTIKNLKVLYVSRPNTK